jgi:hypothetical protein
MHVRLGALFVTTLLLAGCDDKATPPAPPPAPPPGPTPAAAPVPRAVPPVPPGVFAGSEIELDEIIAAIEGEDPQHFTPVGRSTVFRTEMGSIDAAFKVATPERPRAAAAEVAAYRVARVLRLTNVPPAVSRAFPAATLRARLAERHAEDWPALREEIGVSDQGTVRGAMIYWVPDLTDHHIDRPAQMKRWSQWLTVDGELPSDKRDLAHQLSTMLVFDFLIGNWDRFSGGNAQGDASGRWLYLRDHDAAFPRRIGLRLQRRMLARLTKAERFSRELYLRLKLLDPERVRAELARDPEGADLLDDRQMAGLFERRDTILSHIEAALQQHGAERVLVFP